MDLLEWLKAWGTYIFDKLGTEGIFLIVVGILLAKFFGIFRRNLPIIIIIIVAIIVSVYYFGLSLPDVPNEVLNNLTNVVPNST